MAVVVIALVLLAGCSGAGPITPTEATPTATHEVPMSTATATPEPDTSALTVALNDTTSSDREYGPLVAAAVNYWNDGRINRFAAYEAELAYNSSANAADIEIRVVDELPRCTNVFTVGGFRGCAPILSDKPDTPVTVKVRSELNNLQFENTVKHELGHVLGITHHGSPTWLMTDGEGEHLAESVPNASERDHPWNHSRDIRVAVRDGTADKATVEANVRAAVMFYNRHASRYLPNGTNIVLVDNWYRADIVFQDEPPYFFDEVNESQSLAYPFGLDNDSDAPWEQWEAVYIYLANVNPDDANLHAGYWIGIYAGNSPDELPEKYDVGDGSSG